jgi:HlyD family secretion protein
MPPFEATPPQPAVARRSRKRLAWAAIVVACAIAATVAVVLWYRARAASEQHAYVTARATEGPVRRSVIATGSVNPVLTVIVGSYVSGVIQSIACDFNTRVRKGQICATIDPRPYQTAVDSARAELVNARAQKVKDQATLAYAKAAYARAQSLVKPGYVSRDMLDAASSAYRVGVAQVELDSAAVTSREAALDAALVNLGYARIVSPVNGTVVSRNVTIGQTVAASFQTPTLFLIATDMTRMQVDTNVSESDIGSVREGQRASFHVESFPRRRFDATVVQVRQAPQTVQNVVTYDVVLGVDNRDLALKPGMTATARITTAARANVLRVPDQALRYVPSAEATPAANGKGARVWTLVNGRPSPVRIVTGLDDDSFTEVLGGDLKPGERVIVGERREPAQADKATAPRFFH